MSWLRRTALVAACVAGTAAYGLSYVQAQLRAGLDPIVDLVGEVGRSGQRLAVNGLVFEVSSGVSDRSPARVLDALEQACENVDAGFGEAMERLWPGAAPSAAFRLDAGNVGMIACFDLGREHVPVEALAARLRRAVEAGDLRELGPFRVARVRPAGEGAHWVELSSRGSLALARAFPEQGDAPGEDIADTRPAGGRRVLSVRVEGRAPQLASYELDSQAAVGEWIDALRAKGWAVESLPEARDGSRAWQAARGQRALWLVEESTSAGGVVSVLDVAGR